MEKSTKKQKDEMQIIDELGRLRVSLEKRKKLQINTGDKLEVYRSGRNIIVKKTNIRTEKEKIQEIHMLINQNVEINIQVNNLICNLGKYENSKHIIRTIDELGNIPIPIGIREELSIILGDKFKVCIKDDMIIFIKKERNYCNGKEKYSYNNKRRKQNCHK